MGWVGPYLIVKRVSSLNYIIQKSREGESFPVHVDDIKPFIGERHPKSWLDEPVRNEAENTTEPVDINTEPDIIPITERTRESPVQIRSRRERPVKPRLRYST